MKQILLITSLAFFARGTFAATFSDCEILLTKSESQLGIDGREESTLNFIDLVGKKIKENVDDSQIRIIATETVNIQDSGKGYRYYNRKNRQIKKKKQMLLNYAKTICKGEINIEAR